MGWLNMEYYRNRRINNVLNAYDSGSITPSDMMKLGSAVPWPDALEAIVGSREMSALPLVEYFQPLLDWLASENEGQPVGWEPACPPDLVP